MKLLIKPEIKEIKTRELMQEASFGRKIRDEVNKYRILLNDLKLEYKAQKEMLENDLYDTKAKKNTEIKGLKKEIDILEARRSKSLEPITDKIKELEDREQILQDKEGSLKELQIFLQEEKKEISKKEAVLDKQIDRTNKQERKVKLSLLSANNDVNKLKREKIVFDGYVNNYVPASLAVNEKSMGQLVIKVAGTPVITDEV